MVSVTASRVEPGDCAGRAVAPLEFWPSWAAPFEDTICVTESASGHAVLWASEASVRKSMTVPREGGVPADVVLARFEEDDGRGSVGSTHSGTLAALCVAAEESVRVAMPDGDVLDCPLSADVFPQQSVSALFPLTRGLFIEVVAEEKAGGKPKSSPAARSYDPRLKRAYFCMQHPLDELNAVKRVNALGEDQQIIFASGDVPIVVTRNASSMTVWSVIVSVEEEGPDMLSSASNIPNGDSNRNAHIEMPNGFVGNGDEDPIVVFPRRPVLSLRKLYVAPADSYDSVSAFFAHDVRGQLVLCLSISGVLSGLAFGMKESQVEDMAVSFRVRDVACACGVLAVRRPHQALDILVRHTSGAMSLYAGPDRICGVELDAAESPPMHGGTQVLVDAVGPRFTLRDSRAHYVRYTLRSCALVSPLANACIGAISCAFDAAGCIQRILLLYQRILIQLEKRTSNKSGELPSDAKDRDWAVLRAVILSTVENTSPRSSEDQMEVDSQADFGDLNESSDDSAWFFLVSSEYHSLHGRHSNTLRPCRNHEPGDTTESSQMQQSIETAEHHYSVFDKQLLVRILDTLHVLYEDQKLNMLAHDARMRLASLNASLGIAVQSRPHADHYRRDYADLDAFEKFPGPVGTSNMGAGNVPCIFTALANAISGLHPEEHHLFPQIRAGSPRSTQPCECVATWRAESPTGLSEKIIRYMNCLYDMGSSGDDSDELPSARSEKVLHEMVNDAFERTDLDSLPFGVSLPLRDALRVCRQTPESTWPAQAIALIGREDLLNDDMPGEEMQYDTGSSASLDRSNVVTERRALLRIQAASAAMSAPFATEQRGLVSWASGRPTGGSHASKVGEGRLAKTVGSETGADPDDGCDLEDSVFALRFSEDRRLDEVRRMLRSTDPILMSVTEMQNVDDVGEDAEAISGLQRKLFVLVKKRLASPVGRGALTLRTFSPSNPTMTLTVPEICLTGRVVTRKGPKVVLSELTPLNLDWGEFHNGVAAGLRIVAAGADRGSDNGQILTRAWIVKHKPTSTVGSASHAGMLLALGLGGYLPSLKTTDYYEYLVPRHELTSIGLMLGLAAGNCGTMHEKITKMLCVHIRYFNGPGFSVPDFHVAVNVQTAAILGLGLLHQGSCEHVIVEGLFAELGRRPQPGDAVDNREGLALSAGLAIGLVCLGKGASSLGATDARLLERLMLFANGGPDPAYDGMIASSAGDREKAGHGGRFDRSHSGLADSEASRVKECAYANIDVVSPGALLALGLMYLKTNERHVADRIRIPDTTFDLDRARPDHVYLRVLSRFLILWNSILPTCEWLLKTLPVLLRPPHSDMDQCDLDLLGMVGGVGRRLENDVDVPGILHARAFAIAGACTAMALKYAGTSDCTAVATISGVCEKFEDALSRQEKDNQDCEWVYTTCLNASALALAVIVAGSGDLHVLRLLRRLRKRSGPSLGRQRYGSHMAMHMAIGFVFMGGGCQTFGTSNIAIAALLCSIYPRFPTDVTDNQYHLQAMRHLYVLAVEPRCVETRDVDTGMPCYVDVEVHLKDDTVVRLSAPCIVPESHLVKQVSVISERYWPTTAHLNPAAPGTGWYSSTRRQVLYVKRRTGHLPYSLDPKGSKGILARSFGRLRQVSADDAVESVGVEHLVRAFSADPDILAFVRHFCDPSNAVHGQRSRGDDKSRVYAQILYECLSHDKPEGVRSYLDADRAVTALENGRACPSTIGSLLVASEYVQARPVCDSPLVRPEYLSRLLLRAHQAVNTCHVHSALLKYLRSYGALWPCASDDQAETELAMRFGAALRLFRIPQIQNLDRLAHVLEHNESVAADAWPLLGAALRGGVSLPTLHILYEALSLS